MKEDETNEVRSLQGLSLSRTGICVEGVEGEDVRPEESRESGPHGCVIERGVRRDDWISKPRDLPGDVKLKGLDDI